MISGNCRLELKLVCYAEGRLYRLFFIRYILSKAWLWNVNKSHISNKSWKQWISSGLDSTLKTRTSTARIKEERRDKVFRTLGTGDCVWRYYIMLTPLTSVTGWIQNNCNGYSNGGFLHYYIHLGFDSVHRRCSTLLWYTCTINYYFTMYTWYIKIHSHGINQLKTSLWIL